MNAELYEEIETYEFIIAHLKNDTFGKKCQQVARDHLLHLNTKLWKIT